MHPDSQRSHPMLGHRELKQILRGQDQRSPLQSFPRWLRWRVRKKVARWMGRPDKHAVPLFWGQPMTIAYPEYVSSKIGRYGYFDREFTETLIDLIRPGMVVYDIGAHFGYYSLLASELVGNQGAVYSFEPTPQTYQLLQENASRRENIQCENLAAFSETRTLQFLDQGLLDSSGNFIVKESSKHRSSSRVQREVSVQAVRLDEFATENRDPDFLKIDAEGAEGEILKGMSEIIDRSHPAISLEVGDDVAETTGSNPCRDNVDFLMERGYQVFDIYPGGPKRHVLVEKYPPANLLFVHPLGSCAQLVDGITTKVAA